MIANSVAVRPSIPDILLDATVQVIQAGMRFEERSPLERNFGIGQDSQAGPAASSQQGRQLKKKAANKDDERLRQLVERRHGASDQEDDGSTRTYRNFDERRMGFLLVGDQHRFVGSGGQDKFIFPSAPPLDYSYCMINKIEEIVTENEQPQTKRNYRFPKKTSDDRYKTSSLRLSYNVIDSVEGLINVLYKILDGGPFGLCWLDLSFNAITKLDDDVSTFVNFESKILSKVQC